MKRPSIKLILTALLLFVITTSIIQGGSAFISLLGISKNATEIEHNWLPSVDTVHSMNTITSDLRIAEATHILATDPGVMTAAENEMTTLVARFDELGAAYEKLVASGEEREQWKKVRQEWNGYLDFHNQLLEKSRENLNTEAAAIFSGEMLDVFNHMSDGMLTLVNMNVAGANAEADAASTTIDGVIVLTIAIFAVALIVSIAGLVFVTKGVVKPLVTITGRIKTLAEGDIRSDIPYEGRNDEIGMIAGAVEVFKQNALKVEEMNAEEAARADQTRARAESMTQLMEALADVVNAAVDGDFTQRISLTAADEDLQAVANNVNSLLSTVDEGVSETGTVLSALAEADLTLRMKGTYKGAFDKLKSDTNAVADKLADIVGQLRRTSGGLRSATGEILAGANDLSERTTKQAATVEETSAAMEQLAATVAQNAERAEEASLKSRSMSQSAEEGGQVMSQANQAMEQITNSSSKIANIVGLMEDIAFQTNLLALNASVEAARAGEAGKGFAVVAVEVRRLAQSSAEASSEVKQLIEQSGSEVANGSQLVASATEKLEAILEAVIANNELMGGIAKESREQASAITEVNVAVRQMDEMTQHNAALVEETNAAIEQTEAQAADLDRIVDIFRVSDGATPKRAAPAATEKAADAKPGVLKKISSGAKALLTQGNAAIDKDWEAF